MDMMDYLLIPIVKGGRSRLGTDCWGLVCIIYQEHLGVSLPHYEGIDWDKGSEVCMAAAQDESVGWTKVETSERAPFDVVVLRVLGMPWHVGIVMNRTQFIHADPVRGVCIERLESIHWKNRVLGYYRLPQTVT